MADRWQERAACSDRHDIDWFPEGKGSQSTMDGRRNIAAARKLCASCPVKDVCLAAALAVTDTVGIWAGTTAKERGAMRRPRPELPINHGTAGGYQTHRRRGERPCPACTTAKAEYLRQSRRRTA